MQKLPLELVILTKSYHPNTARLLNEGSNLTYISTSKSPGAICSRTFLFSPTAGPERL